MKKVMRRCLVPDTNFFSFACIKGSHYFEFKLTDFYDSYLKLKLLFSSTLIAFCGIFVVTFNIACYWSIISDYFSSILPMLNFHKKNEKQLFQKQYADFLCSTLFLYIISVIE